jgi:hypothetical protein
VVVLQWRLFWLAQNGPKVKIFLLWFVTGLRNIMTDSKNGVRNTTGKSERNQIILQAGLRRIKMIQTIYVMHENLDIPFVFGCEKYIERFTYYLAHVLDSGYYFGAQPVDGYITQDMQNIKDEILERFYCWINQ